MEKDPADSESETPRGSERILLVEDDKLVRTLVKRVLTEAGYEVTAVYHGRHALGVLQRPEEQIDLLLTDVIMPEMGGEELVNHALRARPDLKVLYMSGYTERAAVFHGHLDPGKAFLQKPLTPESLLHKVREVLDACRRERPPAPAG